MLAHQVVVVLVFLCDFMSVFMCPLWDVYCQLNDVLLCMSVLASLVTVCLVCDRVGVYSVWLWCVGVWLCVCFSLVCIYWVGGVCCVHEIVWFVLLGSFLCSWNCLICFIGPEMFVVLMKLSVFYIYCFIGQDVFAVLLCNYWAGDVCVHEIVWFLLLGRTCLLCSWNCLIFKNFFIGQDVFAVLLCNYWAGDVCVHEIVWFFYINIFYWAGGVCCLVV